MYSIWQLKFDRGNRYWFNFMCLISQTKFYTSRGFICFISIKSSKKKTSKLPTTLNSCSTCTNKQFYMFHTFQVIWFATKFVRKMYAVIKLLKSGRLHWVLNPTVSERKCPKTFRVKNDIRLSVFFYLPWENYFLEQKTLYNPDPPQFTTVWVCTGGDLDDRSPRWK